MATNIFFATIKSVYDPELERWYFQGYVGRGWLAYIATLKERLKVDKNMDTVVSAITPTPAGKKVVVSGKVVSGLKIEYEVPVRHYGDDADVAAKKDAIDVLNHLRKNRTIPMIDRAFQQKVAESKAERRRMLSAHRRTSTPVPTGPVCKTPAMRQPSAPQPPPQQPTPPPAQVVAPPTYEDEIRLGILFLPVSECVTLLDGRTNETLLTLPMTDLGYDRCGGALCSRLALREPVARQLAGILIKGAVSGARRLDLTLAGGVILDMDAKPPAPGVVSGR